MGTSSTAVVMAGANAICLPARQAWRFDNPQAVFKLPRGHRPEQET
jgi:hypothetical protein